MMNFYNKIKQNLLGFRRLSWSERWLFLQAFLMLPVVSLKLDLFGFNSIYNFMIRHSSKHFEGITEPVRNNNNQMDKIRNTVNIVEKAVWRNIYPTNCLPRSMTLWWILRRQGVLTELCMGVRKQKDLLEAHAWVEYRGEPINDSHNVQKDFVNIEIRNLHKKK